MVIKGERVRISPYQPLCFYKNTWVVIKSTTIERCWYKTGLIPCTGDQAGEADDAAAIALEEAQFTDCIQHSLDQIQQLQPNRHIINAEQFTAVDIDRPTESKLTLREAADAVPSNEIEEEP